MAHPIHGNRRLLDRVAEATNQRNMAPSPAHDENIIRTPIDEPLIDRFAAEAQAVGMSVSRTTEASLIDAIQSLRRTINDELTLVEPALAAHRPELKTLPRSLTHPDQDQLYAAELGIVGASAGIAETGTIVRDAGPGRPRSFALLPMTIIVVLDASTLLPDLYDALARHRPNQLPSETVLITGPSKSSDIGMKLVTGVHGPGVVHILIVQDA